MDKFLKIKKKSEEYSLRKIAKKNKQIKARLMELTERERQYQVSSNRLLKASRDASEVYSGISGYELKERKVWADKAMYLRHFSEEKLKFIRFDLACLKKEEVEGLNCVKLSKSRINLIENSLQNSTKNKSLKNEIEEFDDVIEVNLTKRRA